MNQVDRVRSKVLQIETLCAEVINELEKLQGTHGSPTARTNSHAHEISPSAEACVREFDRLYGQYAQGNAQAIREFVKGKSRNYLKVFCRANNLSLDPTRSSKERVADEIQQWFAQRKAILGGVC